MVIRPIAPDLSIDICLSWKHLNIILQILSVFMLHNVMDYGPPSHGLCAFHHLRKCPSAISDGCVLTHLLNPCISTSHPIFADSHHTLEKPIMYCFCLFMKCAWPFHGSDFCLLFSVLLLPFWCIWKSGVSLLFMFALLWQFLHGGALFVFSVPGINFASI